MPFQESIRNWTSAALPLRARTTRPKLHLNSDRRIAMKFTRPGSSPIQEIEEPRRSRWMGQQLQGALHNGPRGRNPVLSTPGS